MTSLPKTLYTIAFYNLENLYDTEDDAFTNDNDFLPTSDKRWTVKRYDTKLYKLGSVISQIGKGDTQDLPVIIGLAEVENKTVLRDLLQSKGLKDHPYKFVHYDSYDERGMDVALLYDTERFELISSEIFPVLIEDDMKNRDFTRDILLVSGKLNNETIHMIVNHWPSRREGEELSGVKRQAAAEINRYIIEKLNMIYTEPNIIVMGDFNDNPDNDSLKYLVKESNLFNAVEKIWSKERGSQNYEFSWNFFDQILVSRNLLENKEEGLKFERGDVFDDKFLTQYNGKFKGQPYRTYVGKRYKGGFSDHFPVYIQLSKTNESYIKSIKAV